MTPSGPRTAGLTTLAASGGESGKLVVFEGPDGVGKSTIAAAIAQIASSRSLEVELFSFPGREPGSLGELVYRLHHDPKVLGVSNLGTAATQALHIAAHIDAIEGRIRPAIESGRLVLLDRFWWSTWVYGFTSGVATPILRSLIDAERAEWGHLKPSAAFLLRRGEPINRQDNLKVWRSLRKEYDSIAAAEAENHPVKIIQNTRSIDAAISAIEKELIARGVLNKGPRSGKRSNSGGSRERRSRSSMVSENQGSLGATKDRDDSSRISEDASEAFAPHLSPIKPSIVYDTYWRFAAERQAVFFRRFAAEKQPWSADAVIQTYKFTNAYRASDRVSQYLIRNVIYRDDLPDDETEVCFRVLLFKLFNKIETWQLLERALGPITYAEYSFDRFDDILSIAMRARQTIYSAAYIMPPGSAAFGYPAKHQNHLRLLERMIADELPKRLAEARSMQRGFELLRAYPTIGDFLAYQFITDINYSNVTSFSEMEFVVPGPGALDGLRKCFLDRGGLNEAELIKFVADIQESECERLGLEFQTLWGRRLQLIDCQNLFCEVDKYARVMHPAIAGLSGRTRIKQKHSPRRDRIEFWYPPKWGINHLIRQAKQDLHGENTSTVSTDVVEESIDLWSHLTESRL